VNKRPSQYLHFYRQEGCLSKSSLRDGCLVRLIKILDLVMSTATAAVVISPAFSNRSVSLFDKHISTTQSCESLNHSMNLGAVGTALGVTYYRQELPRH
jgi:hypothetical protein